MRTTPFSIRLDPVAWKQFLKEARKRDLTAAQLLRSVIREWLDSIAHDKAKSE